MSKIRVKWTADEIKSLAEFWVLYRIKDPLATPLQLLSKVQHEILPHDRHRTLSATSQAEDLFSAIGRLWHELKKKMESDPEPPPPVIIHVEVPKQMDYQELLNNLDVPSLFALLAAKYTAPMIQLTEQMGEIQKHLGAKQLVRPSVTPIPLPMITNGHTKRIPRVAIIGPLDGQFKLIQADAEKAGLKVDLRFVDNTKSSPTAPVSCEYCIITRHTSHDAWNLAQKQFDNKHLFIVHGGSTAVTQKLRDISSMQ